jgi:penicillin-binding protein 2
MADHHHIKDHHQEARIFSHRLLLVTLLILVLIGVLLARFYNLQVVNHQDYVTQSDRNRVQVQPLPPTRGLIYDSNGVLLADNRASFTLNIIKERVDGLEQTLTFLDQLLDLSDEELSKFNKRLRQRRRPYESVPLRYRLSEEEIAKLAVNAYRLPGVEVDGELVRDYPLGGLLAHSVGYVGRINDRELASFSEEEYQQYSGTHTIGKIGLEKRYEQQLLGQVGNQNVETNARGRVLRVLERTDPIPGKNLWLYLDSRLQQQAFDSLAGRRGAVVALDVKTGGVLAMVSTPSYDPNLFVTGISYKDYNALNRSVDLPLFNRTIQGQYPPGSTLKPMLGLGGLHHSVVDAQSSVRDPGYYQLEGEERLYRDWKREGHGHRVKLHQAIVESCDTYYYDLAFRMGIDRLYPFGSQFGLGQRTGIDIPSERKGLWPSRQWKREARGLPWYPGDSLNVGLGQGDVLTTPLQLASMMATMASRGERIQPKLVQCVAEQPVEQKRAQVEPILEHRWQTIEAAMRDVIHSYRGTAQSIRRGMDYQMAGKTGTAQVVGIAQGEEYDSEALAERQRDHALFVAYAPLSDPKIAVAVIVENGEKSSKAAKVARQVIDRYLQLDRGGELVSLAPCQAIDRSLPEQGGAL